ncbi:MAG: hypothetical protein V3W11_00180 [bacterium]
MKYKHNVAVGLTLLTVCLAVQASADKRSYVWTYEYKTVERGRAEVEAYFTLSTPDAGHMRGLASTEHQLELEVGMTERFDFSIYQIFSQSPDEGLNYKGFKLRGRYKIGESGKFVVDPLVYLEYKGEPNFYEHTFELKLVLAKNVGAFNLCVNPIVELEGNGEWELEPEYAVGASYKIGELLRVGAEGKGGESGHYLGPVISHGRDNLWIALGSANRLGKAADGAPEFQLRMLLGVGF